MGLGFHGVEVLKQELHRGSENRTKGPEIQDRRPDNQDQSPLFRTFPTRYIFYMVFRTFFLLQCAFS